MVYPTLQSPTQMDNRGRDPFLRFFRWFIPPSLRRDPEVFKRAELLITSCMALVALGVLLLMMVPWGPWNTAAMVPLPRPLVISISSALFIFGSIAYLVRATASIRLPSILLHVTLLGLISNIAWLDGGFASPVLFWSCVVPLLAVLLSGSRGILVSAAGTTALLMFFYLQYEPTELLTSERALVLLRVQLLLLGMVSFTGWYYESMRYERATHLLGATKQLEISNSALRLSQLNIKQIAENIGQALWMTELDTQRVVYVNQGFEKLWGIPRGQLFKTPEIWKHAVSPYDLDKLPSTPDQKEHIYRIYTAEKEERWIRHVVYPVGDATVSSDRVIHIAADITLKRMAEQLRERFLETVLEVQETERQHLARELHDETGQSLTALLVGLLALEGSLTEESHKEHTRMLRQQLREVVADIGRLSRGLHPAVLDEMGLVSAVARLASDMREVHKVKVNYRYAGLEDGERLPSTVELTIYRIVQEALNNIAKHANARHVDVELRKSHGKLMFSVEDDGDGFDPEALPPPDVSAGGLGLFSMRERIALLGGEVTIESSPAHGTTILAQVPLKGIGEVPTALV